MKKFLLALPLLLGAEPWFTGPILATSGTVVPAGHINWEPYLFFFDNQGTYHHKRDVSYSVNPLLSLTIGITSFMDLQVEPQFFTNIKGGESDTRFGDLTTYLTFQVLRDEKWWPALRLLLIEDFPTGHYEHLNPKKKGTDASGKGAWRTGLGINLQKLYEIGSHYLRCRLNLHGTVPTHPLVRGFNAYGGGYGTDGKIALHPRFTGTFAFEYTLTQNWVYTMDFRAVVQGKGPFSGDPGTATTNGIPALTQYSIAPGIEYNWSKNLGAIFGTWLTIGGKNSEKFYSAVIAINYYN